MFLFITVMLTIVNSISALAAYTIFHDCDPIKGKIIARDDQIMPYFMMKITENIPAIPGIYLSTIFSASLRYIYNMVRTIDINFKNYFLGKPLVLYRLA